MSNIKLFESKQVRSSWNEDEQKWYFSITDVIEILSGSPRPRKYWNALKTKLKQEGSELSQKLGQLKMQSADGKFYINRRHLKRIDLGHFTSPAEYIGEWRCDLHPRFSPNGTKVVIDSPHRGNGRQMYLLDIGSILEPLEPGKKKST